MNIATAISMMVFLQAPADVPKDHWAFPAVDALFKEGLLKGYPSDKKNPLRLDKSIKQDIKQASIALKQWKLEGILVGYPDFHGHLERNDPSKYEIAVAIHAAWANMKGLLEDKKTPENKYGVDRERLPEMARMISMFEPELTQLGANPKEMVSVLNNMNDSPNRLFHGERR